MNDKKIIVENALYILGLKDSNIDEATRRYTYRARSPGVKPTTGIKLILPKTSSMGQKIQKVLDGDDPKKLKQMNNLVIGREDDGKEISLEFKTAASREKFRKMMNEDVQLDESMKIRIRFDDRNSKQVVNDLRDAKKKNMYVSAQEAPGSRTNMFDITFNSRRQFNRFENEYDFLIKKVFEDVQIDEEVAARDPQKMVKGLDRKAKQEVADELNKMNLSGYGDYKATTSNIHKFRPNDLMSAMKKVMKLESLRLEERAMTYVIDRKTKKIVHGPTDTGDAKLYLKKQIQPRKFMIRQIRGAAKKVGDKV